MNKTLRQLAPLLLAFLLGLLAPQAAFASLNNCNSSQMPWSPAVTANVRVTSDVGFAVPGSDTFNTITINCTSNWTSGEGTACGGTGTNWSLVPYDQIITPTAYPGVYTATGMPPGIGYQLLDPAGNSLPLTPYGRHDLGVAIATGATTVPVHLRLVKISNPVAATTFNLNMTLGCTSNEWSNKNQAGSTVSFQLSINAVTQTCSMAVSDLQVVLPQVNTASFSGAGSAAGGKSSTLDFQCDANANARVNFTDATDPANAGDTLKLLGGSTATGVGVRLMVEGTPVALSPNEAFHSGGTELALQNTAATAALKQIPFSAQYVQTGSSVTPGSVQARSLVNISYN